MSKKYEVFIILGVLAIFLIASMVIAFSKIKL